MKRKIAMRCNQEQFESIKDRINLPIKYIGCFEHCNYLVNNFNFDGEISNLPEENAIYHYPEIHKTFNADIFLEACGVEVEKCWKGSEMQRDWGNGWEDCREDIIYRLKPKEFRSSDYQKEIEALQQKAKENGMNVIINFEKL